MKNIIKDYIIGFINGFCMSFADSVPGVSGGTVAFVLGFYEKFVISIDDFFRGNFELKKRAFKYLFKIGIGWIFGLLLSISFLSNLFESHIYELSSVFIGFIIFSIPLVVREEINSIKGNYKNIIFSIFGALAVIIVTYLNCNGTSNMMLDSFNLPLSIYVFLAASLSISVMILPGMSGSTMLLIFGLYIPIITKVKMFLKFDFSVVPILIVFCLGMLFGLIFFTNFLRKCLNSKRSATIYAILGMMVASIYSIIMGPTTMKMPMDPLSLKTFNIIYFVVGALIIYGMELLKRINKEK